MSLSRTALALLLSALMGAPLCCCAYETKDKSAEQQSSCCHAAQPEDGDQQQPDEHVCACRSKDPREAAKELLLPSNPQTDFVPPAVELIEPLALPPVMMIANVVDHTGSDPPTRQRLACLSRWLN
ncbi:MAG: hypothetical protein R3242_04520 [Akkermansiaceae bacterium]|nr:hypothetical protein [Akkermansiaceae bacterium]